MLATRKANPRRKACGECFKSKRRCDQRQPVCSRCRKQKLDCEYVVTPASQDRPSAAEPDDLDPTFTTIGVSNDQYSFDLAVPELDPLTQSWLNASPLDFSGFSQPESWLPTPVLSSWPQVFTETTYYAPGPRVSCTVDSFKSSIARMVRENGTPWSHPLLYENDVPISMLDAHASCALYLAKSEANKHMIFRSIDIRTKALLASPRSPSSREILARVQSLLLYLAIQLFDGDIYLRSQGEVALIELETCNCLLYNILQPPSPQNSILSPSSPDPSIPPSALSWVFQESCRRTFIIANAFAMIYGICQGAMCAKEDSPSGTVVSRDCFWWTVSASIWNASSDFDFKIAWAERERFFVKNMNFGPVLECAKPEDIDDYTKMMLISSQGLDEMRLWYHERGSRLIR